jgi:hypothetical protein
MPVQRVIRFLWLSFWGIAGVYALLFGVVWAVVAMATSSDIDGPISPMGRLYGAFFGAVAAVVGILLVWFVVRSVDRSTEPRSTPLRLSGDREG